MWHQFLGAPILGPQILGSHNLHKIISTHLLTVLTTCVILHAEQRKQHISPAGEIFFI